MKGFVVAGIVTALALVAVSASVGPVRPKQRGKCVNPRHEDPVTTQARFFVTSHR